MGSWGSGVYQNDHAMDLYSLEIEHLAKQLEEILELEPVAWDDIEGPLLYVHLLSVLHRDQAFEWFSRSRVIGWKEKYLSIFDGTMERPWPERRAVIERVFDDLIAALPPDEPTKKAGSKKTSSRKRRVDR